MGEINHSSQVLSTSVMLHRHRMRHFLTLQSSQPDAGRGIVKETCNMPVKDLDLNQL